MEYQVGIIGGGPAGATAALYAARYGLKTLMVSPDIGGWVRFAPMIENWPGHAGVLNGLDLASGFSEQLKSLKVSIVEEEAREVRQEKSGFSIKTEHGAYNCGALILATGTKKRKLGLKDEDAFIGKGLSYCVTCDGPLFRGRPVAVVGGGDSAAVAALILSGYAKRVYMIVREPSPSAKQYLLDKLAKAGVEIRLKTQVRGLEGDGLLTGISLDNGELLKVDGIFVEIGTIPSNELAKQLGLKLDACGLIEVKADMSTSLAGVFAAGDVTTGSDRLCQIVTAAAEGAIAAHSCYNYLSKTY